MRYDYNPQRAIRLIEALGYTRGADGAFRDATNQALALEVRTTSQYEIQVKSFFPIVDYWQKVGIRVDPVVIPPQRVRDAEYRATFPAFEELRAPRGPDRLVEYHGSQARLPQTGFLGRNYPRYINADWDALLDRYFTTIPIQERNQVLAQIIRRMTDELLLMGVFYEATSRLTSNRRQGVTTRNTGWNAHEWEIRI